MGRNMLTAACLIVLAACGENEETGRKEAETATETAMADAMTEALGAEVKSGRTPVEIKTATCLLWPSNFRGECAFEPRGRGSFSVTLEEGERFYDDVSQIVVSVFMEGRADIRVINTDGTSELLGEAMRSETYPACWIGSGFSVCAY